MSECDSGAGPARAAMASTAALAGLRIVELGQWIAAPYCSALLADFGADVIKVEKPTGGDDQRHSSPFVGGQSAFFNQLNRNKRSVALDLSTPAGQAACRRLIADSDVVLENFRPGTLARMGLDYPSLQQTQPGLIYCSISGFGQQGPLRSVGGFDLVVQAMSGLAASCGPEAGPPHRLPIPIADVSTALFAAIGILTALAARERTGLGQRVDVSLLESALAMAPVEVAQCLATGDEPQRLGQASRKAAPYQILATADGAIALGAAAQHLWERTCAVLGCTDLLADPRFARNADRLAHRLELIPLLEKALATDVTASWVERLTVAGVPVGPVLGYREALDHPQIAAGGLIRRPPGESGAAVPTMLAPIHLSATPARLERAAPRLGEHSAELRPATGTGRTG